MKKMKLFFLAAGLLLVTAGVFARKSMFTNYTIFGYTTTTGYVELVPSVALTSNLTTTPSTGNLAYIKTPLSASYEMFGLSGTTYVPLYVNF
jgi:hypothetical protein